MLIELELQSLEQELKSHLELSTESMNLLKTLEYEYSFESSMDSDARYHPDSLSLLNHKLQTIGLETVAISTYEMALEEKASLINRIISKLKQLWKNIVIKFRKYYQLTYKYITKDRSTIAELLEKITARQVGLEKNGSTMQLSLTSVDREYIAKHIVPHAVDLDIEEVKDGRVFERATIAHKVMMNPFTAKELEDMQTYYVYKNMKEFKRVVVSRKTYSEMENIIHQDNMSKLTGVPKDHYVMFSRLDNGLVKVVSTSGDQLYAIEKPLPPEAIKTVRDLISISIDTIVGRLHYLLNNLAHLEEHINHSEGLIRNMDDFASDKELSNDELKRALEFNTIMSTHLFDISSSVLKNMTLFIKLGEMALKNAVD